MPTLPPAPAPRMWPRGVDPFHTDGLLMSVGLRKMLEDASQQHEQLPPTDDTQICIYIFKYLRIHSYKIIYISRSISTPSTSGNPIAWSQREPKEPPFSEGSLILRPMPKDPHRPPGAGKGIPTDKGHMANWGGVGIFKQEIWDVLGWEKGSQGVAVFRFSKHRVQLSPFFPSMSENVNRSPNIDSVVCLGARDS